MTDLPALIRRMADELDYYRMLLCDDRTDRHALATEARAALAELQGEGPSDEQLMELYPLTMVDSEDAFAFARAVLARWGRPAPLPADGEVGELVAWLRSTRSARLTRAADLLTRLALQPVPVSERLPGAEDCDAEGRCWLLTVEDDYPQWRLHTIEDAQPGGAMIWVPVDSSPGVMVDCFYTSHWLPAHALPLPARGEND